MTDRLITDGADTSLIRNAEYVYLEGGESLFYLLCAHAVCKSRISAAAEIVARHEKKLVLLCLLAEGNRVCLGSLNKEIKRSIWLYALKSIFRE